LLHGVDPDRAELAALVHDVADHYGDEDLLLRAEQYGLTITPTERANPRLLQGSVGAAILQREYGLADPEVLEAVRTHVTGGLQVGPLAKILFVADKLEPGRDPVYGDQSTLALAREHLDCAVLKLQAARLVDLPLASSPELVPTGPR
jgi:predicted HD superfamily hydrolase involved in NAD metabolism